MKFNIRFILILIVFLVSFVSGFTNSVAYGNAVRSSVIVTQVTMGHYTYERVLEDNIWWIYVYDGTELVDVYPE